MPAQRRLLTRGRRVVPSTRFLRFLPPESVAFSVRACATVLDPHGSFFQAPLGMEPCLLIVSWDWTLPAWLHVLARVPTSRRAALPNCFSVPTAPQRPAPPLSPADTGGSPFLSCLGPFTLFSCLAVLARPSCAVLNASGECRRPCPIPGVGDKASVLCH